MKKNYNNNIISILKEIATDRIRIRIQGLPGSGLRFLLDPDSMNMDPKH